MKWLALLVLLVSAVAVDASPNAPVSSGHGQPHGEGGGRSGPGYELNESSWQKHARWISSRVGGTYNDIASRGAFADRRLLQQQQAQPAAANDVVPRTLQEQQGEPEVPEWREPLAGIKKQVRSSIVGTPLPANRFDPRSRRLLQQEGEAPEVPEWREPLAGIKKQVRSSIVGTPLPANRFDPRSRRLLGQAAQHSRTLQQEEDGAEVPEWREPLAGMQKAAKSSIVGTPLPANRFDPRPPAPDV